MAAAVSGGCPGCISWQGAHEVIGRGESSSSSGECAFAARARLPKKSCGLAGTARALKVGLISEGSGELSVRRRCELAGMGRSSFYAFCRRPENQRVRQDRRLVALIRGAFEGAHRVYGSRRIQAELRSQGVWCGRRRIGRLMRQEGLAAVQSRRRWSVTKAGDGCLAVPDRLGRNFRVSEPDRVYVADISYIRTDEGWLYLALEIDLYSHRVVGWSLSDGLSHHLVQAALEMAVGRRRPGVGLIHHSDQGVQYACEEFQGLLGRYQLVPSMSRRGDPYGNAVAESFFRTLKVELVYRRHFATHRRHSSRGYLSPAQYEKQTCLS
ncbi:MAG: IS3 family transposase [candidate division WOR-3 bacterium]